MHMIEAALAEPDPLTRAHRFDELGLQHADTRPGVGLRDGLPDLLWRNVPAGSFWMGGDPLALGAWPGRLIDLTGSLFMAAYPVTVAQFQAFIDAGGYTRTLAIAVVEHRLELEAALQLGRGPGWAPGLGISARTGAHQQPSGQGHLVRSGGVRGLAGAPAPRRLAARCQSMFRRTM